MLQHLQSALLLAGIQLTLEALKGCGGTLKEFKAHVDSDQQVQAQIAAIRKDVVAFASNFYMPGFDDL